ncbi:hypothetical protein H9X57_15265 [Flavobacterium piscinae]|uniref:hypothetical protein n=1 Tax=Flavobacterium piscinae TaxID=2506424 RepID=UPI0019C83EC7|nr:hypothetical protein [Flavobacterium piscinae]MBC8884231.1 hypothetical protein [Flavobacterium piscinae]
MGIAKIISGDYPKALDFFSQAKVVYENELGVNSKDNRKLKTVWPEYMEAWVLFFRNKAIMPKPFNTI